MVTKVIPEVHSRKQMSHTSGGKLQILLTTDYTYKITISYVHMIEELEEHMHYIALELSSDRQQSSKLFLRP